MLTTVIKLLETAVILGVSCMVKVGEVTFGIDEFNCAMDELIVTEVDRNVVSTGEALDKRLGEETKAVLLKDKGTEELATAVELFLWDTEGILADEVTT